MIVKCRSLVVKFYLKVRNLEVRAKILLLSALELLHKLIESSKSYHFYFPQNKPLF